MKSLGRLSKKNPLKANGFLKVVVVVAVVAF